MATPDTQNPNRAEASFKIRLSAAELARSRGSPTHISNNSEARFRNPDGTRSLLANFTKGLPHINETGLVQSALDYDQFVRAIDSGDARDFAALPLGPQNVTPRFTSGIATNPEQSGVRAWESMGAGRTFDLEGPDAQAVTMPPAPELDSEELVTEVTECYWMSLLRDVPFPTFHCDEDVAAAAKSINDTQWIKFKENPPTHLTSAERSRLRGPIDASNVFRGITPGDDVGPYLSQFLLVGTTGIANGNEVGDGFIQYGGMRMDQRVRVASPKVDYMTTFGSWLDVQNAADVTGRERYESDPGFRFIHTPRDLATYVHFDALYQAYLNACIILLDIGAPFDSGVPFQLDNDIDKQQAFATFGGPHILSLVTEVATRALKAVRFQKFNVHRRLRPETVGGRVDRYYKTKAPEFSGAAKLVDSLDSDLLDRVYYHNKKQNMLSDNGAPRSADFNPDGGPSEGNLLMPMAFPEGSPMHPAYGAGHATVAGACVTVLKAFFDGGFPLPFAYVTNENGCGLEPVEVSEPLTVDGELNKICSNISIGRNWAGVHYFTDYIESIRIGEEIAIGILQEQKLTFSENFSMTLNKFDGSTIRI